MASFVETMENFRSIAERTVAEANARKNLLTARKKSLVEEAVKCHDSLFGKKGQELAALQRKLDGIRAQLLVLVEPIKQEERVLVLGKGELDSYYNKDWKGLSPEKKWNREILLTIFYRYIVKGEKMKARFWHGWSEPSPWEEEAPESIRNDREIVLGRLCTFDWSENEPPRTLFRNRAKKIQNNPSNFIPDHLWKDKSFVLVALRYIPEALVLKEIPDHFFDDSDVFVALTEVESRRYYCEPWQQEEFRNLFLLFSSRIRSDPLLILLLVQKCGLCLQYVHEWIHPRKCEMAILQTAYEENIQAWEYNASSEKKRILLHDKSFVLQVLAQNDYASPRVKRQLYESLPASLQGDRQIVALMMQKFIIKILDFPATVPRDRDFWLSACRHTYWYGSYSAFWEHLPVVYHQDREFTVLARFRSKQDVEEYLRESPKSVTDRNFWTTVVQSSWLMRWEVHEVMQNHAPQEILHDRELMLQAIDKEYLVYKVLDLHMKADRELLKAFIEEDSEAFFSIPKNAQRIHPDLALIAIQQVVESSIEPHSVAHELLLNLEVAKALVGNWSKHLEYVADFPSDVLDRFKNNQEFGLFATKHCSRACDFKRFTSIDHRGDKAFMLKAVELNPVCLAAGADGLAVDFDVAVVAFSHRTSSMEALFGDLNVDEDWNDLEEEYDYHWERTFLYSIATKAREKVVAFEGFTRGFLYGMSEKPGSACKLPMLVSDDATTNGLKEKIASFVGVPDEKEIGRLRSASWHLFTTCLAADP